MGSDRNDGRVFGGILVLLGACILLLVVWVRVNGEESNTTLLIAGCTLSLAGTVVMKTRSKRDEDNAG